MIPYFAKLKTQKDRDKILKPRVIKIFQNAGLTVLGLKTLEHGFAIAQKVIDELNTIMLKEPLLTTHATKQKDTSIEPVPIKFFRNKRDNSISYDTHLINATYYVDLKLIERNYIDYLSINME